MPAVPSTRRPLLVHPAAQALRLVDVLHALADPTRLTIVRTLHEDGERACGDVPGRGGPSTLTHHFRVLREAGVISQREQGKHRWTRLRRDDLDCRFPGVLGSVLAAAEEPADQA